MLGMDLVVVGLMLLLLGGGIILLPRWNHFKWSLETQKFMMNDSNRIDKLMREKIRHNVFVLENRLPVYGKVIVWIGILIIIIGLALHMGASVNG